MLLLGIPIYALNERAKVKSEIAERHDSLPAQGTSDADEAREQTPPEDSEPKT